MRSWYIKNRKHKQEQNKAWLSRHQEEVRVYQKQWVIDNRDHCRKIQRLSHERCSQNPEWIKQKLQYNNSYIKKRRQTDPAYATMRRLRDRFTNAMRLYSKYGKAKTCKEYGIDFQAIINHLGPCPGPRSEWHIDHIKPLSHFDFNNIDEIKKAFTPENHQWLPAMENLRKGNRV